MKTYLARVRIATLTIFVFSALLFSCISDSLTQIKLDTSAFSEFQTNSSPRMELDTIIFGKNTSVTILDELETAFVDASNISEISPTAIVVRLNEPADSTFALFDSLWIYLKNDIDSVRIAEFSQENSKDVDELTLRRFNVNVKDYLLDPNNLQIGLGYSLDSNSIDTINITLGAFFSVSGELD